jgi:hypothetical protein
MFFGFRIFNVTIMVVKLECKQALMAVVIMLHQMAIIILVETPTERA